jgi:hypothetical protein
MEEIMKTCCCISLLIAQAVLGRGPADTTAPKVVFVKGTEVFSVSADGAGLTQLTKDGRAKWLPRWSQDGTRIAYLGEASTALAQLTLIASDGERLAEFRIHPNEIPTSGMRFVEDLEWLDGTRVMYGGSANPWNCVWVVLDTRSGKEVEGLLGTCETLVRSPDGKSTAYWAPEGMGVSADERREGLQINGVDVYPAVIYPQPETLQFLSNPAWSADSQQVALVDRDVNTGVTSLTVLDARPDRATVYRRSPDGYIAKWAPVLMHAQIAADPDERMEVQWVDHFFVVGKKGGEALYQADPAHRTMQRASADVLQPVNARRAQAAQLKSKVDELMRKLGGRDPDIWTGPQPTTPAALE